MQYYIDDQRIIVAVHDDNVTVPDGAYPNLTRVKTDGFYELDTVLPDIPLTIADYDAAMEKYLYETRCARGYTTREPSDYKDSTVARWRQDAIDYIAFRDAVMFYGLDVQNKFAERGIAPTLDEFLNNMPKITWSFEE